MRTFLILILLLPLGLFAQDKEDTLSYSQLKEKIIGLWKVVYDDDILIETFYEFDNDTNFTIISGGCGLGHGYSIKRKENQTRRSKWELVFDDDAFVEASPIFTDIELINDSIMVWGVRVDGQYEEVNLIKIDEDDL